MSSHHAHEAPLVTPAALAILGSLLLLTVLIVAAVRWSGMDIRHPDAPSVQVTALRFLDLPDGSIDVRDGQSGQRITVIDGEAGFLRGALRVLSHDRLRRGLGPQAPFELHQRQDGRLTLIDPQTGMRLDLESFGPQHASTFSRLIQKERP
ncbi:MAG: photosynthetic complex assembly protein PuhC [Burkholderiaceae bacterium]|jgi:putative photosynthetic complex assembly protein